MSTLVKRGQQDPIEPNLDCRYGEGPGDQRGEHETADTM
jgi:hypothetical protein